MNQTHTLASNQYGETGLICHTEFLGETWRMKVDVSMNMFCAFVLVCVCKKINTGRQETCASPVTALPLDPLSRAALTIISASPSHLG